jgi:SAM-dependent methyltransferase
VAGPWEIPFTSYLEAKRWIDDRSLNKRVLETLRRSLPRKRLRVVEFGSGIGTMITRLIEWDILKEADYFACDPDDGCISCIPRYLEGWAIQERCRFREVPGALELKGGGKEVRINLLHSDDAEAVNDPNIHGSDLVIANSFLDLVDLPQALERILSVLRPNGLFYLTLNFDGLSAFHPVKDPQVDTLIVQRYHARMDEHGQDPHLHRRSQTGRDLIRWLEEMDVRILDIGCSDWVVAPMESGYSEEERTFLHSIIGMVEAELHGDGGIDAADLDGWVERRHDQVEKGIMIYIAHQLDVVGAVNV